MTVSLHGDPQTEFPFFLGYKDEHGEREGEGFNINCPLPGGTSYAEWKDNLLTAFKKIQDFQPDFLVVSLGVDTFEENPISKFLFKTNDYRDLGQTIALLNLPTVFVMEGGFDIGPIGQNVFNVISGFDS
ncbi:hypothetical protein M3P05_10525 [Sansalvadorimonas sp. 2012CJ34-2]|uniref:Histone deacetylase domain-containing protein n=1 Tax=Parendozoicomonas callyspongiae TaxID=2942213 RepID=A0ABT0PG56_9GAMM|nr:hypothetical protein [Sansalvadorimonas sp. 2012CJ34-2]